jgi:hypothetical protein
MPLLEIVPSKKITATVTLEDTTAKQIDQYAAMQKCTADDVIEAALAYVFSKDKDFQRYREGNGTTKPVIPLRIKRVASTPAKPGQSVNGTGNNTATVR